MPNYPYIGEADVRLGLYSQADGKRLALAAPEASRREYVVAKFQLLPQSENIFLIYKDGWHPAEMAAANPDVRVAVDAEAGGVLVPEPEEGRELLPRVRRPDRPLHPAPAGDDPGRRRVLTTFAADSRERKLVTFPITAAQFGGGEMVEMAIELDKTFKPGGADPRELGFRVYHTFIEPK